MTQTILAYNQIPCACGCGKLINEFDDAHHHRRRRYLNGHHRRGTGVKTSKALKGKPKSEQHKENMRLSRLGNPTHWQRGVVKDLYAWCNFCGMRQPWQNKRCDECNKMLRHVVRTKNSKQRREANGEVYRY